MDYAPRFKGHALLVVVDAYSKWIEVALTKPDQMSAEKTLSLLSTFFARHGLPKTLVSDNGTQFASEKFRSFCDFHGIEQKFTAPYSPATNGQAERAVGLIKRGLEKALDGDRRNVAKAVEDFLLRYRSTPHSETGSTPAELFIGRQLRTRLSLMNEVPHGKIKCSISGEVKPGDAVRFRVFGVPGRRWAKGVVHEVQGPRHFLIKGVSTGKIERRHRNQVVLTPRAVLVETEAE